MQSNTVLGDDNGSIARSRGPQGAETKREKELEGTIEAMKRVMDKLKSDNDRLSKRPGIVDDKRTLAPAAAERGEVPETKRAEKLEQELEALQAKLKSSEKAVRDLSDKQHAMIDIRKALKSKEDELAGARSLVRDVEDRLKAAESKYQQLDDQIAFRSTRGAGPSAITPPVDREMGELRERLAQQTVDLRISQAELERSRKEITALKTAVSAGRHRSSSGSDVVGDVTNIRDINRKLSEENARLKKELSAFDLDFFEEIEVRHRLLLLNEIFRELTPSHFIEFKIRPR